LLILNTFIPSKEFDSEAKTLLYTTDKTVSAETFEFSFEEKYTVNKSIKR
jgi:hypothetical protein